MYHECVCIFFFLSLFSVSVFIIVPNVFQLFFLGTFYLLVFFTFFFSFTPKPNRKHLNSGSACGYISKSGDDSKKSVKGVEYLIYMKRQVKKFFCIIYLVGRGYNSCNQEANLKHLSRSNVSLI